MAAPTDYTMSKNSATDVSAPTGEVLRVPAPWREALREVIDAPWLAELGRFVDDERRAGKVFPPPGQVYAALAATPPERVRVLLLGQDPYHDDGQAHGLCFSVPPGVKPPPSLANMFKELASDVGCARPAHGSLEAWATQGVLLLNTVLTVRAHEAHSHKGRGWERFTDAVIAHLNERREPVVFALWGGPARRKTRLIDGAQHVVLEGTHPSPLSAHNGFFGSRPYSTINAALRRLGHEEIDWSLPLPTGA